MTVSLEAGISVFLAATTFPTKGERLFNILQTNYLTLKAAIPCARFGGIKIM